MEILSMGARVLLALVFIMAGLAKLANRARARKSMLDFGVPNALAGVSGVLLPIAELVVAIALFPSRTAMWGAAGSLALLMLFIAGISVNLARGRKPDCNCFGQLHSAPIGWKTLARNIILSAAAVFVIWQRKWATQTALPAWTSIFSKTQAAFVAGGVAIVALFALNLWLMLKMLQQNGRLLVRIEAVEQKLGIGNPPPAGLSVGAVAPDFRLGGLNGEETELKSLWSAGRNVLLLFTDPDCGPCNELLPDVSNWERAHADKLTVAIVSGGDKKKNRSKMDEHGIKRVLLQKEREVAAAYQSNGTPGAVLVGADGKIASALALGPEAIRSLVAQATRPEPAKMGELAPNLQLPGLNGKTVDLVELRGNPTALLFWNPNCGFCRRILEDIKAWERDRPKDAPGLVIISTGTTEENMTQGFLSTVVLDKNFSAGNVFGANGTPSAVMINAQGIIDSKVSVGGSGVLQLLKADHGFRA